MVMVMIQQHSLTTVVYDGSQGDTVLQQLLFGSMFHAYTEGQHGVRFLLLEQVGVQRH